MNYKTKQYMRLNQFRILAALMGWAFAGSVTNGKNALVIQADFGGAVMQGIAYGVSEDLDIFHVRPLINLYDIGQAARSFEYTAPAWPAGTVFVSVVDPGVGTVRKSVVLKTKSGHYFVSPDNGTLFLVAERMGIEAVREIDESVNRRKGTERSHTFHGRDVYSYTGARLAAGVIDFEGVGPLLEPEVLKLENPKPYIKGKSAFGVIYTATGRLGNTACRVDMDTFDKLGIKEGETVSVTIRNKEIIVWQQDVPYVRTFGDVPLGEPLLFINSDYFLSMAINQNNFASTHNIGHGPDWTMEIRKKN